MNPTGSKPTSPTTEPSSAAGRGRKGTDLDFSAIIRTAPRVRVVAGMAGTKAVAAPRRQAKDKSFMFSGVVVVGGKKSVLLCVV